MTRVGTDRVAGPCTVVVGCQWGDEGKGKIVDVLAAQADIVARYQGGANAGHTVHVGDRKVVLHQVPSGVLHLTKRCLLGNGVVLDAKQFFGELDDLAASGIEWRGRIAVSDRAHLVFPYHRALDSVLEKATRKRIGTTLRGIGPAYEAKAGRCGVRVADVLNPACARERVETGVEWARRRFVALGADPGLAGEVDEAMDCLERLPGVATDVGEEIAGALAAGRRVLLEGAQGTALDLDHGTYPFVTSSNTTSGAAALGVGIGPTAVSEVVGVVKAYATRVGKGPLPTSFEPEMDERVRALGDEFGATTGRPRRCGWFDGVLAAYAARVNGLTGIAVTKLDVLDSLPRLRVAVGYRIDGEVTDCFPADSRLLERAEPVYEDHPGWEMSTSDARSLEDLPHRARAYLERIEDLVGAPITMVSVGTRRSQVIQN